MYKHVFRYKTTIIPAHSQRFWGGYGCVLSKKRMKKADIAAGYFIATSIQLFQMSI